MIRGYGSSKKAKGQRRKERRADIPFHRVAAQVRIETTGQVAESRVFLNDLSPNGVGCFVTIPIEKGWKVTMTITQPKPLSIKGEVAWCTPYTLDTKVISPEQFRYRIGIKFIFDTDAERTDVEKYCAGLHDMNPVGPT